MSTWTQQPTHQRWAERRFARLVEFVLPSVLPHGGFAYLDGHGRPMTGREPTLLLTARMTHVAAIGSVLGIPGAGRLLAHGIDSLTGPFHDELNGGWYGDLERRGRKLAYEHVHVILAGASAVVAGAPGARPARRGRRRRGAALLGRGGRSAQRVMVGRLA